MVITNSVTLMHIINLKKYIYVNTKFFYACDSYILNASKFIYLDKCLCLVRLNYIDTNFIHAISIEESLQL